jgi:PTS system galactitol-specific IIB component
MKKILLVCGSGIVTSTIVHKRVEEALDKRGYKGKYTITQAKAAEVQAQSHAYDLCISTTVLDPKVCSCPLIIGTNYLMGRNTDVITDKICEELDK